MLFETAHLIVIFLLHDFTDSGCIAASLGHTSALQDVARTQHEGVNFTHVRKESLSSPEFGGHQILPNGTVLVGKLNCTLNTSSDTSECLTFSDPQSERYERLVRYTSLILTSFLFPFVLFLGLSEDFRIASVLVVVSVPAATVYRLLFERNVFTNWLYVCPPVANTFILLVLAWLYFLSSDTAFAYLKSTVEFNGTRAIKIHCKHRYVRLCFFSSSLLLVFTLFVEILGSQIGSLAFEGNGEMFTPVSYSAPVVLLTFLILAIFSVERLHEAGMEAPCTRRVKNALFFEFYMVSVVIWTAGAVITLCELYYMWPAYAFSVMMFLMICAGRLIQKLPAANPFSGGIKAKNQKKSSDVKCAPLPKVQECELKEIEISVIKL